MSVFLTRASGRFLAFPGNFQEKDQSPIPHISVISRSIQIYTYLRSDLFGLKISGKLPFSGKIRGLIPSGKISHMPPPQYHCAIPGTRSHAEVPTHNSCFLVCTNEVTHCSFLYQNSNHIGLNIY